MSDDLAVIQKNVILKNQIFQYTKKKRHEGARLRMGLPQRDSGGDCLLVLLFFVGQEGITIPKDTDFPPSGTHLPNGMLGNVFVNNAQTAILGDDIDI